MILPWQKKKPGTRSDTTAAPIYHWREDEIPRYPPFMKGLPVVPPERLLETQKELLERIANTAIATPEVYRDHYLSAIRRFASFAHLLPASQSHHHRGAGGLLRHAIEVGLWALQSADRVLLQTAISPSHRRKMEPRWQLAVFLAAMCHDAGKPVTDLTVTNKDRTTTWSPITEDLYLWANRNAVEAYFLDWREGRNRQHTALSTLIGERIIGNASLAWIAEVDTELVVWLMESLSCNPGPNNMIYDLVVKSDQTSVERDLKTMGVAMAGYDIGVPVERHLTDIMRRFVREGVWIVNEPGARLWNIDGNIYLIWPAAGEELARQVKEDGVPGIPRTPDGILDMLIDRGMAFIRNEGKAGDRYWKIAPEVLQQKIPDIKLPAIRLKDEAMVSSVPIAPVPGKLVGSEVEHKAEVPHITNVTPISEDGVVAEPFTDSQEQTGASDKMSSRADPANGAASTAMSIPPAVMASAETTAATANSAPIILDGAIGEALKALAQDLKAGDKAWGRVAKRDEQGQICLKWPDAFSGYGLSGKTVLDELHARGWLWIDPMSPLKKTISTDFEQGDANAIRLTEGISKVFVTESGIDGVGQKAKPSGKAVKVRPAAESAPSPEKPVQKPLPAEPSDVPLPPADEPPLMMSAEWVEVAEEGGATENKGKPHDTTPSIDDVIAVLKELPATTQAGGSCLVKKSDALLAFKRHKVRITHRQLSSLCEKEPERLSIEEGMIRYRP